MLTLRIRAVEQSNGTVTFVTDPIPENTTKKELVAMMKFGAVMNAYGQTQDGFINGDGADKVAAKMGLEMTDPKNYTFDPELTE